jgi:hypothetical protein
VSLDLKVRDELTAQDARRAVEVLSRPGTYDSGWDCRPWPAESRLGHFFSSIGLEEPEVRTDVYYILIARRLKGEPANLHSLIEEVGKRRGMLRSPRNSEDPSQDQNDTTPKQQRELERDGDR